ncbi:unnamed protein product, partial [Owenia fusiformis]
KLTTQTDDINQEDLRAYEEKHLKEKSGKNVKKDFEEKVEKNVKRITGDLTNNQNRTFNFEIKKKKTVESSTFLTICTTFSENEEMRFQVQNNTLLNWNFIKSKLKTNIVVYSNSTVHAENCKTFDCDILPVFPKMTISRRPMLREMLIDLEKHYESEFYGYCNGDILFNSIELEDTFQAILDFAEKNYISGYLILGSRYQVNFLQVSRNKWEFKKLKTGDEDEIMKLSNSSILDKHRGAYDFFFARKSGFPWSEVPPFVVSQPGFDSWLMVYANKMQIPVIDVTDTLTAIHQVGAVKQQETELYLNTHSHNHAVFWSSLSRANLSMFLSTCAMYKTILHYDEVMVVENTERDKDTCIYKWEIQIPDPNNTFYQQLGVLPYDV